MPATNLNGSRRPLSVFGQNKYQTLEDIQDLLEPRLTDEELKSSIYYGLLLGKRLNECEKRRQAQQQRSPERKTKKPKFPRKTGYEGKMERVMARTEMKKRLGNWPGPLMRGTSYEDS